MSARESSADVVTGELLSRIAAGTLRPGDVLKDRELADELGVSRTPVREAIQRLRTMGLIESEAQWYTRIVTIDTRRVADISVVWSALTDALLDEVVPALSAEHLRKIESLTSDFMHAWHERSGSGVTAAAFALMAHLRTLSTNKILLDTIASMRHLFMLAAIASDTEGSPSAQILLSQAGFDAVGGLVNALREGDISSAKRWCRSITSSVCSVPEPSDCS